MQNKMRRRNEKDLVNEMQMRSISTLLPEVIENEREGRSRVREFGRVVKELKRQTKCRTLKLRIEKSTSVKQVDDGGETRTANPKDKQKESRAEKSVIN
jgi:hypothetical protein